MRRALYDVAALVARIVVGVIVVAHGWRTCAAGVDATTREFARWGAPWPRPFAWFSICAEFGGGVLLVLGLLTIAAGIALFGVMAVAFAYEHLGHGLPLQNEGFDLVLALGVVALLLAVAGAGRLSLDHLLFGRRDRVSREEPAAAPSPVAV
ncbi:DoxX family protein [Streptosporangiaceae bacterium NEAU-GS5]|nr:DoxX family protein [Streptosporangiaceae bacterium NEAU-GS5]